MIQIVERLDRPGTACFNFRTGTRPHSFERTFPNTDGVFNHSITTPVVGDVNGDGQREVFFLRNHYLHGLDATGNDLPNFPIDLLALAGGSDFFAPGETLAMADFAGDGKQQIVVPFRVLQPHDETVLFVLNGDGSVFSSWPARGLRLAPISNTTPTIADLDNDGVPEIIIGGVVPSGGILYVLRADGTSFNPHFPFLTPGFHIGSTVAVGDLNGDGTKDLVFVGGDSKVHAIDSNTGQELAGWPVDISSTFASIRTSVALGDVNHDGSLDVVVAADQDLVSAAATMPDTQ